MRDAAWLSVHLQLLGAQYLAAHRNPEPVGTARVCRLFVNGQAICTLSETKQQIAMRHEARADDPLLAGARAPQGLNHLRALCLERQGALIAGAIGVFAAQGILARHHLEHPSGRCL